jgi:hypothetical protein
MVFIEGILKFYGFSLFSCFDVAPWPIGLDWWSFPH